MTVSAPSGMNWEQELDRLVNEAFSDQELQQQLVQNPRDVLKKQGFTVSSDVDVVVVPQGKALLMRQIPVIPLLSEIKKSQSKLLAGRGTVYNGSSVEEMTTVVEEVAIDECVAVTCEDMVIVLETETVVVESSGSNFT